MPGHEIIEVRALVDHQGSGRRLRALDGEAQRRLWLQLYEEHFDGIYRMVLALGVETAEAEDVLQRVFLVAQRRIAESVAVSYPAAWLRGIAVRVVREHRRWHRVRRAKRWLLESTVGAATRPAATPEQEVEAAQRQRLVQQVLSQLSPKLREVLVLLDLQELPLAEVARSLGVPPNTVRSRRRIARERFRLLWQRRVAAGIGDAAAVEGADGRP